MDRVTFDRRTLNRKQYFDSYLRVLRVLRGIYVWGVGAKPPIEENGVYGAKPPE